MFKTQITILIFLVCFAFSAKAGNEGNKKLKTFSVTGKVIDSSGELTGVKVILNNEELTVYTDFEGNFTINNVKEGTNQVTFSMISYGSKIITVNPTETNNLQVKLYGK